MKSLKYSALVSAIFLVVACGGGGGGSSSSSGPVSVPVAVIDGAIKGATVCLDKNGNGACDAGEPSAVTQADGTATLTVDAADNRKYPIIAVVPADAVDADHGVVGTPFVLKAPADQPSVVTPLTTLVQNTIVGTGATSTEAEKQVKDQLGVTGSLFEDFSKKTTDDAKFAGTIARALVVATQKQSTDLAPVIGTLDGNNVTITKAELDKAIEKKILEMLPAIVQKIGEKGILDPKSSQLTSETQSVVTANGYTADGAKSAVAINSHIKTGTKNDVAAGSAGALLSRLSFTDLSNWAMRIMTASAAQNTPDATTGRYKYREMRSQRVAGGAPINWGPGSDNGPQYVSRLHWNGSAWTGCPLNFENTSSAVDSNGNSTYNWCDGAETGRSNKTYVNIAGKNMLDVYNMVRSAGYTNVNINDASTVLNTGTFPAGSLLAYSTSSALTMAYTYNPGASNFVELPVASIAAGGSGTPACTNDPNPIATTDGVTLNALVSRIRGTPCVYTAATVTGKNNVTLSSGDKNERWGYTSLSMGALGTAPYFSSASEATTYYTTNTLLRVAFEENNVANYLSCQQRWDGSTRNCLTIGKGTYKIETMGDAKVMSFAGLPANFAALDWVRVFVERNGHVYYGWQNRLGTWNSARFGLIASNALFAQLGIPTVNPENPIALSVASFNGQYTGTFSGGDTGTFFVERRTDGSTTCAGYSNTTRSNFNCTFSVASVVGTTANITVGVTSLGASFTGTINYNTGEVSGNWSNTSINGTFTGIRY